jgi:hypothetical protein
VFLKQMAAVWLDVVHEDGQDGRDTRVRSRIAGLNLHGGVVLVRLSAVHRREMMRERE